MILFWEGKHAGLSNDYRRAIELFTKASDELEALRERDKRLAARLTFVLAILKVRQLKNESTAIVAEILKELRGEKT
jgi:hypothetical protein